MGHTTSRTVTVVQHPIYRTESHERSGFTSNNQYKLEYTLSASNPTFKDLLVLVNAFRMDPISGFMTLNMKQLELADRIPDTTHMVYIS